MEEKTDLKKRQRVEEMEGNGETLLKVREVEIGGNSKGIRMEEGR